MRTQPRLLASGLEKDVRATPQDFFDSLNEEFGFTLDCCANADNAKCERFFSPEQNAFLHSWDGVVWCNPPYSEIPAWCEKAWQESQNGATVVMLLPAATDTRWFHHYKDMAEVRFVQGRLKFAGSANNAPFGSMLLIFRPDISIDAKSEAQAPHQTKREDSNE